MHTDTVEGLPRPIGYVLGGGGSLGAVQVGMLQALSERDVQPDLVAGTSVGSINGAVLASDPLGAANRLSHVWARLTRAKVFPGNLIAQALLLQRAKTHLFPNTGLAEMIVDFLGPTTDFADLTVPFAAVTMDVATARPHVIRRGRCCRRYWPAPPSQVSIRPSTMTACICTTAAWWPMSPCARPSRWAHAR
ncbi:hypothetical protein MHEL_27700 [Mycolicibacterium helvum]|uniref:PNPLA domain-containing protein n=1 Tax=Mycolicibacterium helvum TaxID=1534349 RepID=A0A7I7T5I6_9MYCO|nr:patatin-like phospholipase family protein [Mycolicibacterium helvum]BBY64527.1 hypothetical protein MHEL_27700 [Mycolicibacterium helvum]